MVTSAEVKGAGRRAGLHSDDVVDAALALVEAEGAQALTMRRLAADLGVATTTIYWHVGGRDELITALIRRLSERQAAVAITGSTPADRIMCVARHVWNSALANRNVTALAHQVGATSLLGMPMELALARELDAAGVRGAAGRDALRAILLCVAGFLVAGFRSDATAHGLGSAESRHTEPHVVWAEVDDTGIDPSTLEALRTPPDLQALFDTTVRAVVDAFVPDHHLRQGDNP